MSKSILSALSQPETPASDPLHELIRQGARDLIGQAVELELQVLLGQHAGTRSMDGRRAIVHNGYLSACTIQTDVGDVAMQVPKVRDRGHSGIKFNSQLLPPYLKRAKSLNELIPCPTCQPEPIHRLIEINSFSEPEIQGHRNAQALWRTP